MFTKQEAITAIMYFFGMTKTEANRYYKNATPEAITEIIRGWKQDAHKAFHND